MKRLILLLLALCLSTITTAQNYLAADGFISITEQKWKRINGITHFCDRSGVNGEQCSDEISPELGSEPGEYAVSKWRTADEYIKYQLTEEFQYIGMSARESGMFLYYKKK
ncbi:hypothetical protein H4J58_00360 [Colwellia sp. MB3u-70]|uniref:hypothetical protein n=1 Tax=unclassified Colwellia TaxID=196834 RepID=UPI0015F4C485|nr:MULTISPECIES: hypothetical protein [unclassified Colwellia]MBA6292989.1 hypothetical protein [Colwellia sp. MB3u-8]MBA6305595.1 hypothetical protein [Colwellia sp. MB3u-70]